ncbi:YceD family protein [Candidatus Contubernalis alkaliaceticus]|uniref:YceD family protein n=1 Tax=Candidatus Contubernalis alkaliaceticus TaxID=338645 RepID=UPI001F4C1C90|nr:DUF177 domain-containing protein [Candidatus Contubernalis alkalaceticus]UNC92760.1 DUF177 domain-containing protein [Candidatus Contubernalis alkalaceticus]
MKIYLDDLKKLQGDFLNYSYRVNPKDINLENTGFYLKCPAIFNVEASYQGRELFLKGTIKTQLRTACSRCVSEFVFPLDIEFHDKFQNPGKSDDEDLDFDENFFQGESFNLRALLKEILIISLPLKPLCSSNCLGLCPVCGLNLNLEECKCEVSGVDPRLEDLKNFFEK